MSDKVNENGVKLRKNNKNSEKVEEKMTNLTENHGNLSENVNNSDQKETKMDQKSLEEQYAELKASNPELLEKTKSKAASSSKPKTTKKRGAKMSDKTPREQAEAVLEKIAKEFKLSANRINAKRGSKSGVGALQLRRADGIKIAVRSNDIVIYAPHSFMKVGVQDSPGWEHVTRLAHNVDADTLEKAFRKAMKDKKSGTQWAIEVGATRRQGKKVEDLEARKTRLEAELKKLQSTIKEKKKADKPKKKTTRKSKAKNADAMAAVAAEATETA